MDRTPCFNTLAANKQIAKIERADAALEDLHAELTNDMQRALAGLQNAVPSFAGGTSTGLPREVLRATADEVYGTLDFCEVMGELMLALKDSTCPIVAKLRHAVIKRYVNENADSIAEARGAYQ